MAAAKITDLTALALASIAVATDIVPLVDVSDTTMAASGTTKKVTVSNLVNAVLNGTGIYPSANVLELRNSTTAQEARVYRTYTDASNYERGVFKWGTITGGVPLLEISGEAAGTGTARNIVLQNNAAGNVQIGNSSGDSNPTLRLVVFSSSSSTKQLRLGNNNSFAWDLGRDNVTTGNFAISNGTDRLTIAQSDGKVTITNGLVLGSLADGSAANSTLYYSTTASKLVYKDSGGTVNALY